MTDYKAIKVPKGIYDSITELKKVIIINGYNSLPSKFRDFLKDNNYDITNISMGNMVNLTTLTTKFLFENK